MGSEYKTVEGELGAVNALTNLTTFGTETTGPIKVPNGRSKLVELWVALGITVDTSGDQGAITLRLTGKGIKNSPQDFIVGGAGVPTGTLTATAQQVRPATIYPVDIDCEPNEEITVQAAAVGDDVLIATVGVTLVFA
mgnify:CR=1 FL=1